MLGRRNVIMPDGSKAPDQKQRPRVEALERRALLATLTVTNTNDSGTGSLRDAITQVDNGSAAAGSPDTINFQLPAGSTTIAVQTALPAITRPVIINGPTQTGLNDVPNGPGVTIDGTAASAKGGVNGLVLSGAAGGSQINNLDIVGFTNGANGGGRGILVQDGGGDNFTNNFLGVQMDGVTAQPNAIGIEVQSPNNTIGPANGALATTRGNLISGNSYDGILIDGAKATGNLVVGNLIGTDSTGTGGVGNLHGIEIQSATGVTIGGTTAANRNTISGNGGTTAAAGVGILFTGTSSGDIVAGNNIGTDSSGNFYVGNGFGISFGQPIANNTTDQISNITVGGTVPGSANILSGNSNAIFGTVTKSTILGNLIGTDTTGAALLQVRQPQYLGGKTAVGNGYGILLGGGGNTIGGTSVAARNIIVGSGSIGTPQAGDPFFGTGLSLAGSAYTVQGNSIGIGLNGTAIPNIFGVYLNAATSIIGGTTAGAGNLIGGNVQNGITLTGQSGNTIQGNVIGNPLGGTLGNGANGIGLILVDPSTKTAATDALALNDTIGGIALGATNIIAGNGQNGVAVFNTYGGGYLGLLVQVNAISNNGGLGVSTGPVLGTPQPTSLVVSSAVTTGLSSTVQGVIGGAPGQTYVIDLYNNAQLDANGRGQGQVYLGTTLAKVGPGGLATFSAQLPVPLGTSPLITAAYTPISSAGVFGSTSEFSAAYPNSTPKANLVLTQQTTPTASVGGNITITATVTNNGTGPAQNVVLTDALNGTLVNASASTKTGAAFIGAGNVAYATLGTLAPGASATVTITAGTSASQTLTNTVGVLSNSPETSYTDNQATATVLINPVVRPTADLAITATPTTTTPTVGLPLVFVLDVTNNGPTTATNVLVSSFFPTGLGLVNGAGTQGSPITINNAVVQDNLGTLAPGASAQVWLNVIPTTAAVFNLPSNVASSVLDPVTGNNSATATVTARAATATSNATTSTGTSTSTGTGTSTGSGTGTTTAAQTTTVASVTGSRSNAQLNVTFSSPVTAALATARGSYLLYDLGTTPRALTATDRPIAITSIARSSTGTSVSLTPSRAIRSNQYYTLVVLGGANRPITTTTATTFLAGTLSQT